MKKELVTVSGTVVHRLKNVGVDALAMSPAQKHRAAGAIRFRSEADIIRRAKPADRSKMTLIGSRSARFAAM